MELDPDLAALRPLGGFFVLRTAGAALRPLPTLTETYGEPPSEPQGDPLGLRVRKVADALRAPEPRIAASIAQQGLAARLWSVTLGCAALYGRIPDLDPRLLRWDPEGSAPDDLWLTEVRPLPSDPSDPSDPSNPAVPAVPVAPVDPWTIADVVLHAHLEPLTAALHARYRLAAGLLWGNAGSALAGAARQLDQWARANGRTDAAARTRALTAELFGHPLLADTGTLTGTAFRRRSCCLYYRVPGGGVCGDCCFTRPPRSSPHATSG